MKLSVAIITYNEALNIARCLDSVKHLADEIIVVDSFSEDQTEAICEPYDNLRFIQYPFEGHIQQKNFALAQCHYPWVLSLDADEALSPTLQDNILHLKKNISDADEGAYAFNRKTWYCGKWIYHSGWYPDKKIRLLNTAIGQWGGENPHDKIVLKHSVKAAWLAGDILHYTYSSKETHRLQIEKFSGIAAQAKFHKGEKSSHLKAVIKALAKWVRSYLIKQGFRDGKVGWHIAHYAALSTYLKYLKLMHLWQKK